MVITSKGSMLTVENTTIVDGVVQQLAVRTIGGVVTLAQCGVPGLTPVAGNQTDISEDTSLTQHAAHGDRAESLNQVPDIFGVH